MQTNFLCESEGVSVPPSVRSIHELETALQGFINASFENIMSTVRAAPPGEAFPQATTKQQKANVGSWSTHMAREGGLLNTEGGPCVSD